MTKWRTGGHAVNSTVAHGDDRWCPINGMHELNETLSESVLQFYVAWTVSDLSCRFSVMNADSVDVSFADDGTASTNVTVNVTGTGNFEDTTGSETPAVNSECSMRYLSNQMHGDDWAAQRHAITLEHASATQFLTAKWGEGIATITSSQYLQPVPGEARASVTTEANVEPTIETDITYQNMRLNCTIQNESLAVVFRVNRSDSSNLTITVNATGEFEDLTGSESLTSGDEATTRLAPHTTSANTYLGVQYDTTPTVALISYGGFLISNQANSSRSGAAIGTPFESSETNAAIPSRIDTEDAENLGVNVNAVSSLSGGLYTIHRNAADSTNVTISVTGTGVFQDLTGSESYADSDTFYFVSDTAGGTYDYGVGWVEFPDEPPAPAGINSDRLLVGHGQGTRVA